MTDVTQLYVVLCKRQAELQAQVFESPPKTMEQFELRRGQWIEVTQMIEELKDTIHGKESDS